MKPSFISFFCAIVFLFGFTEDLQSATNKKNSPFNANKQGKTTSQSTNQRVNKVGGLAFTCPAARWSGKKADFYYHFTLVHITTQDLKIVKLVHNAIKDYIIATVPLVNGHHSLSWDKPGSPGVNSLFFKGPAADFKLGLHNHLMGHPIISPYLSPYIEAHVDVRGDFTKQLYSTFTVDQIIERKTR